MESRLSHVSLLWKILLSTSVAITVVFAVTGWIVQSHAARLISLGLQEEVRTSFEAYQSLWRARSDLLSSVSLVLSRMPDVRAAFGTGDHATIRDTAGEIWSRISREGAIFLVTDPHGAVIASLGRLETQQVREIPAVVPASRNFPRQASGFMMYAGGLYQIVITPVYVESAGGPALLDVLVAGYAVDSSVANNLKASTGGSDFVFASGGAVVASTLPKSSPDPPASPATAHMATPLLDLDGKPLGELRIYRSLDAARQYTSMLRRDIFFIWAAAVLLCLGVTYVLARRMLKPVQELDRAAAEIGRGNYECKVNVESHDELGRLARTFNDMSASLRNARDELIRQERISTIARLSTSLVHDLRNPLAAIYGGAEMLVDSQLTEAQVKRLAVNIYNSSRRVQELLQVLADVSRGGAEPREMCRLADVVGAAWELHAPAAEAQAVAARIEVPPEIELPLERSRTERVFANLIHNALEVMPRGGAIDISAHAENGSVIVAVEDTGPGIAPEIAPRLFQPFVTMGKKNGLGLGLAMSRQTILDQGGDMWADPRPGPGARFCVRLPARGA